MIKKMTGGTIVKTMRKLAVMLLITAWMLSGCGIKQGGSEPETNKSTDKKASAEIVSDDDAKGAESEKELIETILDKVNNGTDYAEIADLFDWNALVAYYMIDDNNLTITMNEVREIVDDLDKGAEYINEHYPDFCAVWKVAKGEEVTDEALSRYVDYAKQIGGFNNEYIEGVFTDTFGDFIPVDSVYNEENLENSERDILYRYNEYSIPVIDDNKSRNIVSLNIHFYKAADGRYYAFMINNTVS